VEAANQGKHIVEIVGFIKAAVCAHVVDAFAGGSGGIAGEHNDRDALDERIRLAAREDFEAIELEGVQAAQKREGLFAIADVVHLDGRDTGFECFPDEANVTGVVFNAQHSVTKQPAPPESGVDQQASSGRE
jgi:hypothetical protein